jgi:hypothetical protein
LRLGLGDNPGAGRALLIAALAIVIRHPRRVAPRQGRVSWSILPGWGRHGKAEASNIPGGLHHGRAGRWPSIIIETRTQLFQLGNSLEAAPFRDKRQICRDFAR